MKDRVIDLIYDKLQWDEEEGAGGTDEEEGAGGTDDEDEDTKSKEQEEQKMKEIACAMARTY